MAKGYLFVKPNDAATDGIRKMGLGLSIQTAADQNHKPALRVLPFWKNEIFSQILAWVSAMAQGLFSTIEVRNRWAQLESRRYR